MPYDRNRDPFSTDTGTPSSQPRRKIALAPGAEDLEIYAKAIAVHTDTDGDRVTLSYLPVGNDDDEVVTIKVSDGWVSETSVRRVLSAAAAGGAVSVYGLY